MNVKACRKFATLWRWFGCQRSVRTKLSAPPHGFRVMSWISVDGCNDRAGLGICCRISGHWADSPKRLYRWQVAKTLVGGSYWRKQPTSLANRTIGVGISRLLGRGSFGTNGGDGSASVNGRIGGDGGGPCCFLLFVPFPCSFWFPPCGGFHWK